MVDELNEYFRYDPSLGKIFWKKNLKYKSLIGKEAGSYEKAAIRITFMGKRYMAHHIAWYLYYGEWPNSIIDHINRNPFDNKIENLRLVTERQNSQNTEHFNKGATFCKRQNKWLSQIVINKTNKFLGYFDDELGAQNAYLEKLNQIGHKL